MGARAAHWSWRLAAIAIGAACVDAAVARAPQASTHVMDAGAQSTVAPAGAETIAGVEWVRVALPAGGSLVAAVARPTAPEPHPVLLVLHGTHGFAREYVALASDLARASGALAVAACWFAGGRGAGRQFVTPLDCPEAPPIPATGMTPDAVATVSTLVDAVRSLPGARADRIALVGHSRGAVAALSYALERGQRQVLRAIVLNSGAYPPELVDRAVGLTVPLLMLHGTADSPAGGGSEMTAIARARAFEAALRGAGKVHHAEYFEGAGHEALFSNADHRTQSVRRVADFLRRHGFQ